jgi:hypothetical protein
MIHDESGSHWPKNSLLIAPYKRAGKIIASPTLTMKQWLGSDYETREGDVTYPPRAQSNWEDLGLVYSLYYVRNGEREKGLFVHRVKEKTFPFFGRDVHVYLRRWGVYYRIDFPDGLTVTWRGVDG